VTAIHQFVPTLAPRDAVGTHYLAVQEALRDAGYTSDIYALEAKDELRRHAKPYRAFTGGRSGEDTWILYHSSVGSPVGDFVLERSEPLLLDHHNITPASFFQAWEPSVVGVLNLGRRQLARLAPRAVLGLADSTFNAQELEDMGVADTRVVPIMLDVASLDHERDPEVVERIGKAKGDGGTDWLFVGRIAPNKAQHDVVKAFAAYRRFHDPAARLHLVGATSAHRYETTLREFIAALELERAVNLTGPVSAAALSSYYEACDVFVVCSEHEGFLVPLLEAMHHQLPVVAFASSAIPETLGGAGLLLDTKHPLTVAAAVERVVVDRSLRDAMVRAGVARLAEFDVAHSRRKLLDALAPVVGAP
jgi:glycosyltransferase involved in cell wall biosynthesis